MDTSTHESEIDVILSFFSAERKSEVKKLAKTAVITRAALADVVLACKLGVLPWRHKLFHRQLRPAHLEPNVDELNSLGRVNKGPLLEPRAKKALSKMVRLFDERRILVGHLFVGPSDWHFIYFDQRDASKRSNHWAAGPHVHIISHLWPRVTIDFILESFFAETPRLTNSEHVRFDPCDDR